MENINYSEIIQNQYNTFKKYMLKSTFIEIDNNFMEFLQQESIIINQETLDLIGNETISKIKKSVLSNEGFNSVFIKINFSAPTDSDFIVNNLKCYNLDEILILIKGSQKLISCLNFNSFSKNILIIKNWYKIEKKNEFRLFINNQKLILIAQRNIHYYFSYTDDYLINLFDRIKNFFNELLKYNLIEKDKIFIDILLTENKIKIIDLITENIRLLLNLNSDNLFYGNSYFLFYDNWDQIEELKNDNNSDYKKMIKIINTEEEIIWNENNNKFPIEILNDDNRNDIYNFINSIKLEEEKNKD